MFKISTSPKADRSLSGLGTGPRHRPNRLLEMDVDELAPGGVFGQVAQKKTRPSGMVQPSMAPAWHDRYRDKQRCVGGAAAVAGAPVPISAARRRWSRISRGCRAIRFVCAGKSGHGPRAGSRRPACRKRRACRRTRHCCRGQLGVLWSAAAWLEPMSAEEIAQMNRRKLPARRQFVINSNIEPTT